MNKIQNQLNIIRLDENKAKTNLTLPIQDIISSSNSRLINTLRKNILEFEKERENDLILFYIYISIQKHELAFEYLYSLISKIINSNYINTYFIDFRNIPESFWEKINEDSLNGQVQIHDNATYFQNESLKQWRTEIEERNIDEITYLWILEGLMYLSTATNTNQPEKLGFRNKKTLAPFPDFNEQAFEDAIIFYNSWINENHTELDKLYYTINKLRKFQTKKILKFQEVYSITYEYYAIENQKISNKVSNHESSPELIEKLEIINNWSINLKNLKHLLYLLSLTGNNIEKELYPLVKYQSDVYLIEEAIESLSKFEEHVKENPDLLNIIFENKEELKKCNQVYLPINIEYYNELTQEQILSLSKINSVFYIYQDESNPYTELPENIIPTLGYNEKIDLRIWLRSENKKDLKNCITNERVILRNLLSRSLKVDTLTITDNLNIEELFEDVLANNIIFKKL